ncbi:MAG: hypothetical protein RRY95_02480 [Oscillospiraceae bacterium]
MTEANLVTRFEKQKIVLVTGHYGSGKTEFAVNLALQMAASGRKTALADLDIVNPYFRSRERRGILEAHGIRLIATSQSCTDADVPSLPADILVSFQDPALFTVYDVGGDPAGARVLARWRPQLMSVPHEVVCVLNANRPETATMESAIQYIRNIEATCGLTIAGLVNNTHLCGETTEVDIAKGKRLADAVSAETGIPVVCHVAVKSLAPQLAEENVYPIDIYMKKPWE